MTRYVGEYNMILLCIRFMKGGFTMSYEKPQVKKIEADVSVRNMADDKGECHGGHCVRCIHAFG